jgi:hypothetical protein
MTKTPHNVSFHPNYVSGLNRNIRRKVRANVAQAEPIWVVASFYIFGSLNMLFLVFLIQYLILQIIR